MRLCYNCGNTLEPDLPFCTECGTAAPRATEVAPPQPPAPSKWDSTSVASAPPPPAYDDVAATEITPISTPKSGKLPLIVLGVVVLVIATAVLLLVLKPFSNEPPALGGIEASQLIVNSGEAVTLTARATDPNDDTLTYKWTASSGQVIGDGSSVMLSTAGVDATSGRVDIRVHVTVSDDRGGTALGDQTIGVTPAIVANPGTPPGPPGALGVDLEADQSAVRTGETVMLTATVSNRDPNEVTYAWRASAGTIRGGGRSATLDTSGVQLSGSTRQISVTVTAKDAAGTIASDTTAVSVAAVPPSNWPPTISLRANRTGVQQGEDVEISANATDRDGDPLTYSWNVAGGQLSGGGGNRVTLRTAGANPGTVEVSATVSDGRGESATDRVTITVNPRANHSPTISSVDPDRTRARVGEKVSVSARASDPDNDELRYSWTSSAGSVRGSGSTVTLNTSGIEPDSGSTQVRLTVTVNDQRGGVATDSGFVTVFEQRKPPEPPRRAGLSGYQAMEGEDLIVTLTGSPGATEASSGMIDVTAGVAGTVQISGAWPSGPCRVNAGSQQNVDRISIVQSPLPSNGYAKIILRVRPKNSKQSVRFTISWRAL